MDKKSTDSNFNLATDNNVFFENLNSLLAVKRDYENKELDSSWIDIFEETLPYLDNILRNPKRFIINEEEIVKVELAKRITVESVIHLTQHTNLIQDYDELKGDVMPSKILNINKEESLDTYENRFIYTLIQNMQMFFEQRINAFNGNSSYFENVNLKYNANSKIGTEEVKVTVDFQTMDKNLKIDIDDEKGNIEERLKKIKIQLLGFMGSELMQILTKLRVAQVRSPIRKTNVILKNPNFQKATELWNFLQNFSGNDYKYEKENEEYMDQGELKLQLDQAFFLSYLATDSLAEKHHQLSEKKAMALTVSRLIENLLDFDENITSNMIQEIFHKELKKTKEKIKNRDLIIKKTFEDKFNVFDKQLLELYSLLD